MSENLASVLFVCLNETLRSKGRPPLAAFDAGLVLFAGGAGLDSFDFAELVVRVEAATGRDPFREAKNLPAVRTMGDLLALYEGPAP